MLEIRDFNPCNPFTYLAGGTNGDVVQGNDIAMTTCSRTSTLTEVDAVTITATTTLATTTMTELVSFFPY